MPKIDLESRFYNFCTRVNNSLAFQLFSLGLIVFVSIVIAMSVVPDDSFFSEYAYIIKLVCSFYFLFEIYIDAIVIVISFLPITFISNLLVLRLFRILSQPQITKYVPKIAITNFSVIVNTGIKIIYVFGIIVILTYVFAIIGIVLY